MKPSTLPLVRGRRVGVESLETRLAFSVSPIANVELPYGHDDVAIGAYTYFVGTDAATNDRELWRTDGTAAGTKLVHDSNPGTASGNIQILSAVGTTLFYYVDAGANKGLWKTDGTSAGTSLVSTMAPGAIFDASGLGSSLYLATGTGLWRSDGTSAGTAIVSGGTGIFYQTAVLGNELFATRYGGQLVRIRSTAPAVAQSIYAGTDLKYLTVADGVVWFTDASPTVGTEVFNWSPASSTVQTLDLVPGSGSSVPYALTASGNYVYFVAGNASTYRWLYRADHTGAVTTLYTSSYLYATFDDLTPTPGGNLYFTLYESSTNKIFRLTGSTRAVQQIQFGVTSGNNGFNAVVTNGEIAYFATSDDSRLGLEWYRTDASGSNASLVGGLTPDAYSVIANGKFVFSATLASAPTARTLFVDRLDRSAITGKLWQDRNGDGTLGTSDQAIYGRTVWLDTDADGQIDPGESTTTSNATGDYQFFDLPAGTYSVREVLPDASWIAVSPATNLLTITTATGATVALANFTSRLRNTGVIRGSAFDDYNDNGVLDGIDRNVPTATPRTIFVDTNNNGALDAGERSTLTGTNGLFTLLDVPIGAIHLKQLLTGSWHVALPAGGSYDFNLADAQETASLVFASKPPTASLTMTGRLFVDTSHAGTYSPGMPLLANTGVFIDLDNDLTYDAGEPTATTDTNGLFTFTALDVGKYTVRLMNPAGYYGPALATTKTLYDNSTAATQLSMGVFKYMAIVSSAYDVNTRQLSLTLDRAAHTASTSASGYSLTNLDTGTTVPISNVAIAFGSTSRDRIVLTLSPTVVWPDGRYRLTVSTTGIRSANGADTLAAPTTVDFYLLIGDANRDRSVNFDDLLLIAKNYGLTGTSFSQGDFDYSGTVDFNDMLLLAKNYNKQLAAATLAMLPAATEGSSVATRHRVIDGVV